MAIWTVVHEPSDDGVRGLNGLQLSEMEVAAMLWQASFLDGAVLTQDGSEDLFRVTRVRDGLGRPFQVLRGDNGRWFAPHSYGHSLVPIPEPTTGVIFRNELVRRRGRPRSRLG